MSLCVYICAHTYYAYFFEHVMSENTGLQLRGGMPASQVMLRWKSQGKQSGSIHPRPNKLKGLLLTWLLQKRDSEVSETSVTSMRAALPLDSGSWKPLPLHAS